jgi:hypothetical protein
MSDYSFTYHDNGFSLDNVYNATLFLKLGKTGLSFLIASQGRLLAWKDACPLTALIEDAGLGKVLAAPYKEVRVGLLPEALTLIPTGLFAPEKAGEYARYLDVKPGNKVFSARMDANNYIIYKISTLAFESLASKINLNGVTIPADRGWITANAGTGPADHALYADVNEGQVSLLNFNGGRLRFYNVFDAQGIDDMLYYCLYTVNQLNLKPDEATLMVSGKCADEDMERLRQFFRSARYNDSPAVQISSSVQQQQVLSLATLA